MKTFKTFLAIFAMSVGVASANPGLVKFFESENGTKLVQAVGAQGYSDDLARAVGLNPSAFSGKTPAQRAKIVAERLSGVTDPAVVKAVQKIASNVGYSLSPTKNGVTETYTLVKAATGNGPVAKSGAGNGDRAEGSSGGFAAPGSTKAKQPNSKAVETALAKAEKATGQDLNWIIEAPLSEAEKLAALKAAPSTLRPGCQASTFGDEAQNNLASFMAVRNQGDGAVLGRYKRATKREGQLARNKIDELCVKCNICVLN